MTLNRDVPELAWQSVYDVHVSCQLVRGGFLLSVYRCHYSVEELQQMKKTVQGRSSYAWGQWGIRVVRHWGSEALGQ